MNHSKKGLPLSDLQLLQSSFENGLYNGNHRRMYRHEKHRHMVCTYSPNYYIIIDYTLCIIIIGWF